MLTRVYIDNFKSLVNFEFKPGPIQLILGDNGSGKSSFAEAIWRLRSVIVDGVDVGLVFRKTSLTRWDSRTIQTFEITVEGNGGSYVYRLGIDQHSGDLAAEIVAESLSFEGRPLFSSEHGENWLFHEGGERSGHPSERYRSGLFSVTDQRGYPEITWFKSWMESLYCMIVDSNIQPNPVGGNGGPDARFTNFAMWLDHQRAGDPASLDEFIAALKSGVIEGFERMAPSGAGRSNQKLSVDLMHGPDREGAVPLTFNEWELSDGQVVLIKLYAVALCVMKPGSTLILDDPFVHVSLREIQPWLTTLLDRSDDIDSQVIIISHHPEIINYLAGDKGVFFSRGDNGPVRVKPAHFDDDPGLTPAEEIARGWVDG